jgi:hypothetical protein
VEDAAGTAVIVFRAQDFSIPTGHLWPLDTLADVGFEVDFSIFPRCRRSLWTADPLRDPRVGTLDGFLRRSKAIAADLLLSVLALIARRARP